jgi:mannose-6-phosphate isomerase-like protein (cupin superfamily)
MIVSVAANRQQSWSHSLIQHLPSITMAKRVRFVHSLLQTSLHRDIASTYLMRETDTIVYAASGHGAIVSGPNGSNRQELAPGDFALIPAYAEHQEVNDSDEDVRWIITRGGRTPIVHNLERWSKSQ